MKNLLLILFLFCSLKSVGQNAENSFVYENNGDKIVLKIDTENPFLIKDRINPIIIQTENIDIQALSLSGPGLMFATTKSTETNELLMEIDLVSQKASKKYTLHFSYRKNEEFYHGTFKIPIKKKKA